MFGTLPQRIRLASCFAIPKHKNEGPSPMGVGPAAVAELARQQLNRAFRARRARPDRPGPSC
jgi:hypothetical protein